MTVYALTLSYRGDRHAGWQRQDNALAVQQVVEEALADLLGRPATVVGAGRTDAGVHARGQVAHLELAEPFPERGLVGGTNARLPEDIRVLAAERMADGFHARKRAAAKLYSYRMLHLPVLTPFEAPFALHLKKDAGRLDLTAMRRAADALVGRHDFSAFALAGGSHRDPRRRILAVAWRRQRRWHPGVAERSGKAEHGGGGGYELLFQVVGDGFLRGMVRSLVGTLLEVGRGQRSVEGFEGLLAGGPRSAAGPTAPARGLTLERVFYPPPWGDGWQGEGLW